MGKPLKFTAKAREAFLAELAESASPRLAAARAGIERRTAYRHREDDPEFAAAWDRALDLGLDQLLEEAFRRSVQGVEEPVVHQGQISQDVDGNPVTVRRYSDRLLEVLLKWRYPEKMADRLKAEVDVSGTLGEGVDVNRLSREERTALKELLLRAKAGGTP
ncbi:hypothetical protein [Vulgatibacter sp.]|uniref:hypothetical protein n=1 Tax=Vulgatibacter sp. TaxID=1971226 RepID=UPI00356921F5